MPRSYQGSVVTNSTYPSHPYQQQLQELQPEPPADFFAQKVFHTGINPCTSSSTFLLYVSNSFKYT